MSTVSDTTTNEPKAHNAKDILQEALDTIQATFWIQGDEFNFVYATYVGAGSESRWDEWEKVNKAILAELGDGFTHGGLVNPTTDKAKITGVCSIGALALANVTLYNEPLASWDAISGWDLETWKAGAALVSAIYEGNTEADWYDMDNLGTTIARWNDYTQRTREEVIDVFTKALKDPMLTATVPVEILYRGSSGEYTYSTKLYFPDEAAAQAFLDGDSELLEEVQSRCATDRFIIQPAAHEALVNA
jgi:hypothetical protein